MGTELPSDDVPSAPGQLQKKTVAMNEALLLGSIRQHELTEAAENINAQLRVESEARATIATELSQKARELAEKARLLELTDDAIIVRDAEGRISYWNHGAEVLYGWSREEALGKTSHALLQTESSTPMEQIAEELERNGRWTGELVQSKRDGQRITVLVRKALDRDSRGNPVAVLQSITDITERKRWEEALRVSETSFRAMADAMAQLVWIAHADGYLHWYNQRWYEYTGTTPQEMAGWGWQSVHDPEVLPKVLERWKVSIATGEPFEMIFPLRGADGKLRRFLTRGQPLKDAQGRVTQWFGTNTDVEELQRAEAALKEAKEAAEAANQSKDRFLAVLSHELRTPLTPVLMAVEALENDPDLRPDVREDMVMIKRNIELETKLIDDLLDLNRIINGKLRLHLEAVDLNAAVRQVCDMCGPQAQEQGVRLEYELAADAGTVAADPARLQQVLWNLLKNAIKFTPKTGSIHIATGRTADRGGTVQVRDSGRGIAPEILPRIFDAFEQGDPAITRQFGGLGLGLAISKALMELHEGSLRAESAGAGQGATFTIELPAAPPALAAPALHLPAAGGAAQRLRLLLVEDHHDTARKLQTLLERSGYAVSTAGDVASALELAGRETFDLLISDLGLPDGSGYDVMAGLQKTQPLPGIAMSGYGMDGDVRRSREAGFAEHLVKPIGVPQLRAAIRRVMEPKA